MTANSYYYRRIHSILGIIPIGFFLIEHLLSNYAAFQHGPQGFVDQINWLHGLPLLLGLEIFLIWLPLLYHGIYGLFIAYSASNNVTAYRYFRNIMFKLQRYTGVITLMFIAWHVFSTRFQLTLGNVKPDGLGTTMHNILTNPWYFGLYVIGIVSTTFHFSNGIWSFLVSWGITIGPRAQRVSTYVCMGIFVLMTTLFILSLAAFTGAGFQ